MSCEPECSECRTTAVRALSPVKSLRNEIVTLLASLKINLPRIGEKCDFWGDFSFQYLNLINKIVFSLAKKNLKKDVLNSLLA